MASTSYHKENLRRDLIAGALAHVEEHGHGTLSVRALAQRVGVSPGAPYHHFPDRRSLLLAVAVEGFTALIAEATGIADASGPAVDKLIGLGTAFIRFTTTRPRLAELMYESELTSPSQDPQLEILQRGGQKSIRDVIQSALASASDQEIEIKAVAFWSAVYGFAALRRKHNIPSFEMFAMQPDEVARSVVTQAAFAAIQA